jgi:hypothetical protein
MTQRATSSLDVRFAWWTSFDTATSSWCFRDPVVVFFLVLTSMM